MAEFADVWTELKPVDPHPALIKADALIDKLFLYAAERPDLLWPSEVLEIAKRGNRYRDSFEFFLTKHPTPLAIDFWLTYISSSNLSLTSDHPTVPDLTQAARNLADAYVQHNGERPITHDF